MKLVHVQYDRLGNALRRRVCTVPHLMSDLRVDRMVQRMSAENGMLRSCQ